MTDLAVAKQAQQSEKPPMKRMPSDAKYVIKIVDLVKKELEITTPHGEVFRIKKGAKVRYVKDKSGQPCIVDNIDVNWSNDIGDNPDVDLKKADGNYVNTTVKYLLPYKPSEDDEKEDPVEEFSAGSPMPEDPTLHPPFAPEAPNRGLSFQPSPPESSPADSEEDESSEDSEEEYEIPGQGVRPQWHHQPAARPPQVHPPAPQHAYAYQRRQHRAPPARANPFGLFSPRHFSPRSAAPRFRAPRGRRAPFAEPPLGRSGFGSSFFAPEPTWGSIFAPSFF